MTISSTTRKAGPYTGNGVATAFAFAFKVFAKSDVVATLAVVATGVESTLVLDTDYTVTLNADQNASPGGTVTYNPSGTPMASTHTLTLTSNVPQLQPLDLTASGGFFPSVVNAAFDRCVILIQQLALTLTRVLRAPLTDPSDIGELPPAADRALNYLAFDANGDPIASTGLSSTPVSAAMAPVVASVSLGAGRATLGATAVGDAVFTAASAAAARTAMIAAEKVITTKGDFFVGGAAGVEARKAIGSAGQVLVPDSSQSDGLIWTDFSRDPLNTNPNWQIDQLNAGALYTVGASTKGPDGWRGELVGAGVFKLRTLADPDNAALKCLEITCTTADATIAAADTYSILTAIEGYDTAGLKPGTAGASKITVQFAFKTNITGVYGLAFHNSALNRSYIGTITVVDTAEHDYAVTLTLDTAGTWLYTNGVGCYVRLTLAAGSNFQNTAGAWAANDDQTTSAQCNFMSSTSNIAYLKRFHVIPSGVALAYSMQDIGKELARAQRYQFKTFAQATAPAQNVGVNTGEFIFASITASQGANGTLGLPVKMRTTPTVTLYSPGAASAEVRNESTSANCSSTSASRIGESNIAVSCTTDAGAGNGNLLGIHMLADARLT